MSVLLVQTKGKVCEKGQKSTSLCRHLLLVLTEQAQRHTTHTKTSKGKTYPYIRHPEPILSTFSVAPPSMRSLSADRIRAPALSPRTVNNHLAGVPVAGKELNV